MSAIAIPRMVVATTIPLKAFPESDEPNAAFACSAEPAAPEKNVQVAPGAALEASTWILHAASAAESDVAFSPCRQLELTQAK
jgi:hypothetical protein